MTYEELIKKGSKVSDDSNNNRLLFEYNDTDYLVHSGNIIDTARCIFIYDNGDHRCYNDNHCYTLKRGKRILYETKSGQTIYSCSAFDINNTKYEVVDKVSSKIVEELDFPFNSSILDVIDYKLKGE